MASNLTQRILTAVVMVPVVLGVVFYAPPLWFTVAVALLAAFTIREYFDLAAKLNLEPQRYAGYVMAVLYVLLALSPYPVYPEAFFVMLPLTLAMHPSRNLVSVIPSAASTVFGVLYVAVPFYLLVRLFLLEGWHLVLYVLLIIWISDTAAYFGGRAFGRHKLAPRVSPGKTWEGAICSIIGAMLFGYFYLRYTLPDISLVASLIMAVTINIAGQLGDLAESAMKRGAGVKDSGTLLPGHGGALDRVDALLFAIPVLWYDWFFLAKG